MADWLRTSFGQSLCESFFYPFHDLYTAGLFRSIAPQDPYKSPINMSLVIQGAFSTTPPVGYNTRFVYPVEGLNALVQRMASRCDVRSRKAVVRIDVEDKAIYFDDGSALLYSALLSTLPLNRTIEMTGLAVEEKPNPSPSVLVINIGAIKASRCPMDHWVYVPKSKGCFHRVGFYSNVDASFLPASVRGTDEHVSIYVEKAYGEAQKPEESEVQTLCRDVVEELREWGWIREACVVDSTWIDVAYTWSWPGSGWREKALEALESHGIYQLGRFGRWVFQGIADSIRDGLMAGAAWKEA
jgi:protoporphyrinogen oxidase